MKEPAWSSSIAAGSKAFVSEIQGVLGVKTDKRMVEGSDQHWLLREPNASCNYHYAFNLYWLGGTPVFFLNMALKYST